MDREENAAALEPSLIAFRFVFGNAHSDQGSDDAADSTTSTETGKTCHDGTGCDERPDARNGKRTDPDENTECAADDTARSHARSRTFRRLCILLVRKVPGA